MKGTIPNAPIPDNFAYVVPVDEILHPLDKPFCWDSTCGCKTDETLLLEVSQFIHQGLMTLDEGIAFVAGRTV
jgi:hypothetical protein